MNLAIRVLLLATYAAALAGIAVAFPGAEFAQRAALILLAIHVVELAVAFRHVRRYRGPLAVSIALTLLFGLLHWKPLADAARREAGAPRP